MKEKQAMDLTYHGMSLPHHQAIEAKASASWCPRHANRPLKTTSVCIVMTGTAKTEEEEFRNLQHNVIAIPTKLSTNRTATITAVVKFRAVVQDINNVMKQVTPILASVAVP